MARFANPGLAYRAGLLLGHLLNEHVSVAPVMEDGNYGDTMTIKFEGPDHEYEAVLRIESITPTRF